jgi:hypothetical protein
MFSPIGNAIGQVIPTIIVVKSTSAADDDDDFTVTGMTELMVVELVLCIIPLVLAVALFRDQPPTPPSNSTMRKVAAKAAVADAVVLIESHNAPRNDSNDSNDALVGSRSMTEVWTQLRQEARELFSNRNYLVLFAAFSIGVGFFNSLLTLLNQIVAPHGYSNDDAGAFGAVFVAFGLVGAGLRRSLHHRLHSSPHPTWRRLQESWGT